MKITKKELQRAIQRQESRIDGLVGLLAKKGYYDKEPELQLKQLDQSVFDGLDKKWRWAAVDQNAETNSFEEKPVVSSCGNYWVNASGAFKRSVLHFDNSNWQNSLIERDTAKELTGSDLCRAMLKRGDKYVMCKTSGTGEAEAMEAEYPDVIQKYDWEFFYTPYKKRYAVPINNQGEPLTAADVGL